MAKRNERNEQEWLMHETAPIPGSIRGPGARWEWLHVDTAQPLTTTTDPGMRNWKTRGWEELNQDDCPWGIYDNIHEDTSRKSNNNIGVASADFRPRLKIRLTQEEAQQLARMIREQAKNTYSDLFQ